MRLCAAILLALSLIGIAHAHYATHKPRHDNYLFRDYVCSADNFKMEPDTCGKLKELFETPRENRPPLPPEAEMGLLEIYKRCCEEA